ncbi:MAG: HAD family hydrolase [Lachnospiraceae bacterium]|nr:HAD family hydrolase [Lachnospiraceae bacterium]
MNTYRLAAFDMDGTLLDSDKEILPSSLRAFERALAAGKILALDTGRAVSELSLYHFADMGIRYGSCACGTVIYDFQAEKVLLRRTIPSDLIPLIVEISRKEDLMFQAMLDGVSYVEKKDVDRMDLYQMGVYQPLYLATTSYAEDVRAFALDNRDKINKINLYHADPESRERTRQRLSSLPLDLTFAETTSLECTPRGVSKGSGLLDLCSVLGIPAAAAIGVGDAFNDVPMLEAAGLGIAMGNSNEAALSAAGAVVADNDHDGIAQVIDLYLLS